MKKAVAILVAVISLAACKSGDKKATADVVNKDSLDQTMKDSLAGNPANPPVADTANNTTIQWLDSTYLDLGKQKEGKEIEISFRFKNTGSKNLVIQSVSAQCGCTIPEKPEKPFAPGEEGIIKAKYNGSGHGETRKEVYVTANTSPASHTLTFRAELNK
ncbi:MAG: DUF1573 domain-containing protein [Chitinophagaceae bacterium]